MTQQLVKTMSHTESYPWEQK